MQNNNRPVFESFDQFVQFVYEAVQLNEADTAYASPLLKLIKGTMKLSGTSATEVDTLITQVFNKIYTDFDDKPDYIESGVDGKSVTDLVIEELTKAFDLLNNSAGLKTIPGSVQSSTVTPTYGYLVSGTVRAKDMPFINNSTVQSFMTEETTVPLGHLLVAINSHNLFALCNIITSARKKRAYLNAGTEANVNQFDKNTDNDNEKIIQIDSDSLAGELITFKPYAPKKLDGDKTKYAWQFPLYGVLADGIQPGDQIIDANYYDEVIAPAGNDVVVKDQVYDAPDVKFFGENGVTISEEGKRQLKSVLSQYNSIQTIIVNGGASSKPTSYKSKSGEGNPALATDRMNAGLAELNALKKSGVAQLASTKIEAGKAEVQPEGEKSDSTKQQVSFIISGMIKSTQLVPKEAVVIKNTEEIKADKVTFTQYTFQLNLNEEPNAKNMEARA
jgi:hypothetical protein